MNCHGQDAQNAVLRVRQDASIPIESTLWSSWPGDGGDGGDGGAGSGDSELQKVLCEVRLEHFRLHSFP